jgi:LAGLIDADG endonuclease
VNKNTRNEASFRVNSLQDLAKFIIPHFENYPLLTQKAADFLLFTQIVKLMNNKVHLTEDGLQQIINLRASMNLGLSDLHKYEFPNYNPVARPLIISTKILDPNWIAGFAIGEGCFFLSIFKSNKNKIGHAVQLIFKLTQHKKDKQVLELIDKFLNCWAVYYHSENAFVFKVTNFADIKKIIIPMFKVHPIQGIKQLDYQDFFKVAALINKGKHLSHKGLAQILLIKDRMNTKRKFPKI